jgi:hypothetical protein
MEKYPLKQVKISLSILSIDLGHFSSFLQLNVKINQFFIIVILTLMMTLLNQQLNFGWNLLRIDFKLRSNDDSKIKIPINKYIKIFCIEINR